MVFVLSAAKRDKEKISVKKKIIYFIETPLICDDDKIAVSLSKFNWEIF